MSKMTTRLMGRGIVAVALSPVDARIAALHSERARSMDLASCRCPSLIDMHGYSVQYVRMYARTHATAMQSLPREGQFEAFDNPECDPPTLTARTRGTWSCSGVVFVASPYNAVLRMCALCASSVILLELGSLAILLGTVITQTTEKDR